MTTEHPEDVAKEAKDVQSVDKESVSGKTHHHGPRKEKEALNDSEKPKINNEISNEDPDDNTDVGKPKGTSYKYSVDEDAYAEEDANDGDEEYSERSQNGNPHDNGGENESNNNNNEDDGDDRSYPNETSTTYAKHHTEQYLALLRHLSPDGKNILSDTQMIFRSIKTLLMRHEPSSELDNALYYSTEIANVIANPNILNAIIADEDKLDENGHVTVDTDDLINPGALKNNIRRRRPPNVMTTLMAQDPYWSPEKGVNEDILSRCSPYVRSVIIASTCVAPAVETLMKSPEHRKNIASMASMANETLNLLTLSRSFLVEELALKPLPADELEEFERELRKQRGELTTPGITLTTDKSNGLEVPKFFRSAGSSLNIRTDLFSSSNFSENEQYVVVAHQTSKSFLNMQRNESKSSMSAVAAAAAATAVSKAGCMNIKKGTSPTVPTGLQNSILAPLETPFDSDKKTNGDKQSTFLIDDSDNESSKEDILESVDKKSDDLTSKDSTKKSSITGRQFSLFRSKSSLKCKERRASDMGSGEIKPVQGGVTDGINVELGSDGLILRESGETQPFNESSRPPLAVNPNTGKMNIHDQQLYELNKLIASRDVTHVVASCKFNCYNCENIYDIDCPEDELDTQNAEEDNDTNDNFNINKIFKKTREILKPNKISTDTQSTATTGLFGQGTNKNPALHKSRAHEHKQHMDDIRSSKSSLTRRGSSFRGSEASDIDASSIESFAGLDLGLDMEAEAYNEENNNTNNESFLKRMFTTKKHNAGTSSTTNSPTGPLISVGSPAPSGTKAFKTNTMSYISTSPPNETLQRSGTFTNADLTKGGRREDNSNPLLSAFIQKNGSIVAPLVGKDTLKIIGDHYVKDPLVDSSIINSIISRVLQNKGDRIKNEIDEVFRTVECPSCGKDSSMQYLVSIRLTDLLFGSSNKAIDITSRVVLVHALVERHLISENVNVQVSVDPEEVGGLEEEEITHSILTGRDILKVFVTVARTGDLKAEEMRLRIISQINSFWRLLVSIHKDPKIRDSILYLIAALQPLKYSPTENDINVMNEPLIAPGFDSLSYGGIPMSVRLAINFSRLAIEKYMDGIKLAPVMDAILDFKEYAAEHKDVRDCMDRTYSFLLEVLSGQGKKYTTIEGRILLLQKINEVLADMLVIFVNRGHGCESIIMNMVKEIGVITDSLITSKSLENLKDDIGKLFCHLFLDENNNLLFKYVAIRDLTMLFKYWSKNVSSLPIPRIEIHEKVTDFIIDNLTLQSTVVPNMIKIDTGGQISLDGAMGHSKGTIGIKLSGIYLSAENVGYMYYRKKGVFKGADYGMANLSTGKKGISISLQVVPKLRRKKVLIKKETFASPESDDDAVDPVNESQPGTKSKRGSKSKHNGNRGRSRFLSTTDAIVKAAASTALELGNDLGGTNDLQLLTRTQEEQHELFRTSGKKSSEQSQHSANSHQKGHSSLEEKTLTGKSATTALENGGTNGSVHLRAGGMNALEKAAKRLSIASASSVLLHRSSTNGGGHQALSNVTEGQVNDKLSPEDAKRKRNSALMDDGNASDNSQSTSAFSFSSYSDDDKEGTRKGSQFESDGEDVTTGDKITGDKEEEEEDDENEDGEGEVFITEDAIGSHIHIDNDANDSEGGLSVDSIHVHNGPLRRLRRRRSKGHHKGASSLGSKGGRKPRKKKSPNKSYPPKEQNRKPHKDKEEIKEVFFPKFEVIGVDCDLRALKCKIESSRRGEFIHKLFRPLGIRRVRKVLEMYVKRFLIRMVASANAIIKSSVIRQAIPRVVSEPTA